MSLIFKSTKEVIPKLKNLIDTEGHEFNTKSVNGIDVDLTCVELNAVTFKILDFDDIRDTMLLNGCNPLFAEHDFRDRVSKVPLNPGNAIKFDNTGVLKPYLKNGKLDYTYGERLCHQYETVIDLLKSDPNTRQAFLTMWDPVRDSQAIQSGDSRVPCSIGYQFLYREGQLNCIYYMRSLHILKCLPYDMYTSFRLLKWFSLRTNLRAGSITFQVGSLHYFRPNRGGNDE